MLPWLGSLIILLLCSSESVEFRLMRVKHGMMDLRNAGTKVRHRGAGQLRVRQWRASHHPDSLRALEPYGDQHSTERKLG